MITLLEIPTSSHRRLGPLLWAGFSMLHIRLVTNILGAQAHLRVCHVSTISRSGHVQPPSWYPLVVYDTPFCPLLCRHYCHIEWEGAYASAIFTWNWQFLTTNLQAEQPCTVSRSGGWFLSTDGLPSWGQALCQHPTYPKPLSEGVHTPYEQ